MRTIPAGEIKRRGISVVDGALKEGPVRVIQNDHPPYVILDEAHYEELLKSRRKTYVARVKAALKDLREGRVRRVTARKLIDELDLEA